LRRLAGDPKNLIVLAGFQAAGTRGRALLEGARTLRMHGQNIAVHAGVLSLDGFSAHADANELLRWATAGPSKPGTVFLAHGEPGAQEALADRLRSAGLDTLIPRLGEEFSYSPSSRHWRSV
jgi:metallo-beta-lactamase family protein